MIGGPDVAFRKVFVRSANVSLCDMVFCEGSVHDCYGLDEQFAHLCE